MNSDICRNCSHSKAMHAEADPQHRQYDRYCLVTVCEDDTTCACPNFRPPEPKCECGHAEPRHFGLPSDGVERMDIEFCRICGSAKCPKFRPAVDRDGEAVFELPLVKSLPCDKCGKLCTVPFAAKALLRCSDCDPAKLENARLSSELQQVKEQLESEKARADHYYLIHLGDHVQEDCAYCNEP